MQAALRQADQAAARGEVPIGAVVVAGGKIVGRGHNLRESRNDPTAHAEMIALRQAARKLKSWRLEGAAMFVTCEPCPMCAGALVLARVKRLVYGCDDPKAGAVRSLYRLLEDPRLNHRLEVVSGLCETECQERLRGFFSTLRKRK
jgi:tRNA(adenine34) deaminase